MSFLFCRFLKSGVTNNELKSLFVLKSKKVTVIYLFKTRLNIAVGKMLVWSAYVWRTATATFFKNRVIYELGSLFQSNSLYLKKWQCREHIFIFHITLTINITLINITLCILEKSKIKSALRAIRSCWSWS